MSKTKTRPVPSDEWLAQREALGTLPAIGTVVTPWDAEDFIDPIDCEGEKGHAARCYVPEFLGGPPQWVLVCTR